jgi:taurine transport system permease protein
MSTVSTAAAVTTSSYRIPGQGKTFTISLMSTLAVFMLWFMVSNLGIIKPLFLPALQAVWEQFWLYFTGAANDKPLWHAAYSMGASQWQVIRHVMLPAALPEILVGMRIAIGFGWTTLVAAEMVAASVGLGQMVLNASNFLRTDIVIMGIIVIGVFAYLFDLLMRFIENKLVPWKGKA